MDVVVAEVVDKEINKVVEEVGCVSDESRLFVASFCRILEHCVTLRSNLGHFAPSQKGLIKIGSQIALQ